MVFKYLTGPVGDIGRFLKVEHFLLLYEIVPRPIGMRDRHIPRHGEIYQSRARDDEESGIVQIISPECPLNKRPDGGYIRSLGGVIFKSLTVGDISRWVEVANFLSVYEIVPHA